MCCVACGLRRSAADSCRDAGSGACSYPGCGADGHGYAGTSFDADAHIGAGTYAQPNAYAGADIGSNANTCA